MFLHVFVESARGPRRVQEADSDVFLCGFFACGPHHTRFYVSAVVAASFGVVWRRFPPLSFLSFWLPFCRIICENTCRERWRRNRLRKESHAL